MLKLKHEVSKVKFVDEVPKQRRWTREEYDEIAETLRQHPGKWALVLEGVSNKSGPLAALTKRGLVARGRSREEDRSLHDIYAMYPEG
jgi:hypothetical protein